MVAHHEIADAAGTTISGKDWSLSTKAGIKVAFLQRLAVHVHLAVIHADVVSGHTNHAFNEAQRRISRIVEHYNIAALDRL